MHILYVTSEWPTESHHWAAPFLVRQVEALRRAGVDVEVFHFGDRGSSRTTFVFIAACTRKSVTNGLT